MAENKKIKYLIADTTAFINEVQLNNYAENILTVPDVVNEVRNKRQIRRLCVLPYDLQVRDPRPESVKHCLNFAKKTGDYASLSGIDIKVISLTYELELENVGCDHLRSEPIQPTIIASKEKPVELRDPTKLVGWYNPKKGDAASDDEDVSEEEEEYEDSDGDSEKFNNDALKESLESKYGNSANNEEDDTATISHAELEKCFAQLNCESDGAINEDNILVPDKDSACKDEVEHEESNECDDDDKCGDTLKCEEYAEESGWITPANIRNVKRVIEGEIENDVVPVVACMSTDYAIQNVLKQINLNVCALNGRSIKHLRTSILRCYACFKTTSIVTKVFCGNCGNKTLKRVAVSLDEDGKQVIHINTRRPLTAKYKNQPLPRFRGGKHSRNPILFEDQPIPRQMPSRVAKTKTNALHEDYIAGFSPFAIRDVNSKSALLRAKGNIREWARNNNFEEERRKRFYNRLCK